MIRVDQTTFGVGQGNCFASCLACFLEIPADDVPNFCCEPEGADWWGHCEQWLDEHGWRIGHWYMALEEFMETMQVLNPGRDIYWIAGGPCPPRENGLDGPHCCVYRNGELWHDPNPERTGLLRVTSAILVDPKPTDRAETIDLTITMSPLTD